MRSDHDVKHAGRDSVEFPVGCAVFVLDASSELDCELVNDVWSLVVGAIPHDRWHLNAFVVKDCESLSIGHVQVRFNKGIVEACWLRFEHVACGDGCLIALFVTDYHDSECF